MLWVQPKKEKEKRKKKRPWLELLWWLSRLGTQRVSRRIWVQSLALLGGSRIRCCREHRSQMWFRSGIAVAVV